MSESINSNQKNQKLNHRKSPSACLAKNLARGTVLYSACHYNGITLEYHLAQRNSDLFELIIYFRMVDFQEDYIIGITLDQKPLWVDQNVYHGVKEEIINRVARVRHDNIVLLDGVRDFLEPGKISALRILLKMPEGNCLEHLDFWLNLKKSKKEKKSSLAGAGDFQIVDFQIADFQIIPELVNFQTPRLGLTIEEAYPDFPRNDWWKYPLSQNLIKVPPKPRIDWVETKNDSTVEEKPSALSLRELSQNLRALELKNVNLQFNHLRYQLSLENPGEELVLTVLTQHQAYQLLVPAKTSLEHQIESLGPVQVYVGELSQGTNNTLLVEDLKKVISVDFVEALDGLWIYWDNQLLNEDLKGLIEVYQNGKFWKMEDLLFFKNSQNKNLVSLADFGIYLIRVFLIQEEQRKPISQYEFVRLQPQVTMTSLPRLEDAVAKESRELTDSVTIMQPEVEVESEPEVEPESEIQEEIEPEIEASPEPEVEPEVKPEPEIKPEPEEVESEPKLTLNFKKKQVPVVVKEEISSSPPRPQKKKMSFKKRSKFNLSLKKKDELPVKKLKLDLKKAIS